MSVRYIFSLKSEEGRRPLPSKIIIGQEATETIDHVLLKLVAYLIFYRERLQIDAREHMENLPFLPDLVQLDYELRVKLWIECGECSLPKLHKLAVKVPEAEIWIIKKSEQLAHDLLAAMQKEELRTNRYGILGLNSEMFEELRGLLKERNEITWFRGTFDPPNLQFDFNGLWFDVPFTLLRH